MLESTTIKASQRWIVVFAASLLFFYNYIQLNMLNSMAIDLIHAFHIDASQLGVLSSMYFYGSILLMVPVGLLVDRFSPHKMLVLAMLASTISTFMFANAHSLFMAYVARFLCGLSGACVFLPAVKLATRWFPPQRMAFVTGVMVTMAMLGSIVAQTPVALLSSQIGWRMTTNVLGVASIAFLFLTYYLAADYPPGFKVDTIARLNISVWTQLKAVFSNRYNWLAGACVALLCTPFFVLGALWGNTYLVQADHITKVQAANIDAMLFFGMLIGAPLAGRISDAIKLRVAPMMIATILAFITMLLITYVLHLQPFLLEILFFLLGFFASFQVIGYPLVTELNSPLLTGSALTIPSLLVMAAGFIGQPLFGWILDFHWDHLVIHGMPIYALHDFQNAMWIVSGGFVLCFIFTLFLKETRCCSR